MMDPNNIYFPSTTRNEEWMEIFLKEFLCEVSTIINIQLFLHNSK